MKKSVFILPMFLLATILLIGAGCAKKSASPSAVAQPPVADTTMVDCGEAKDPGCFINRMNGCLPVTTKMIGTDGETTIDITIFGIENDKCHFQRKINGALNLDCLFPKGTMNTDTLSQTFGDDKGLQKVVDDNCKSGGW